MADIVFVTPNMSCMAANEPLGTLIVGTLLKKAGFSVKILPMGKFGKAEVSFDLFLNNAVSQILQTGAKIVSFYTRCDTYHLDILIAQHLKQQNPALFTVFGGPQSDLCAEDTIRAFSCIDFICRGEGETTIVPFFSSLLKGAPDLSIPGLVFSSDGLIQINPRPELLKDFSSSTIDYQLLLDTGDSLSDGFLIDVGRGCPFNCTFCSTKLFWKRQYRLKSPQEIINDIIFLHDKFNISKFIFDHDMFTMNHQKVEEICAEIKKLPFKISWSCSARLDCVNEALIDIMADAGLCQIYFGIETGSPRMQKLINKNLDLTTAEPLVRYLKKKGIFVVASFIYGFPEETPEDLSATLALWAQLRRHKNTSCQTHLLAFFPGTELELRYRDQLTLSSFFSNQTGNMWIEQCYEMIAANPAIFSQYRSLPTALRESVDRIPDFLKIFRKLDSVFSYLAESHFDSIYDLYLAWKRFVGKSSFRSDQRKLLATAEEFLRQFESDPYYPLMSDICRYLSDKAMFVANQKESSFVNNYCFLVSELSEYRPLSQFSKGSTLVSLSRSSAGKVIESTVVSH